MSMNHGFLLFMVDSLIWTFRVEKVESRKTSIRYKIYNNDISLFEKNGLQEYSIFIIIHIWKCLYSYFCYESWETIITIGISNDEECKYSWIYNQVTRKCKITRASSYLSNQNIIFSIEQSPVYAKYAWKKNLRQRCASKQLAGQNC